MFSEYQRFWILAHVFGGPRIVGALLMFFRGPRVFWALAHVFGGPKVLDPGSCLLRTLNFWILANVFQRTKVFGLWLMFS